MPGPRMPAGAAGQTFRQFTPASLVSPASLAAIDSEVTTEPSIKAAPDRRRTCHFSQGPLPVMITINAPPNRLNQTKGQREEVPP